MGTNVLIAVTTERLNMTGYITSHIAEYVVRKSDGKMFYVEIQRGGGVNGTTYYV